MFNLEDLKITENSIPEQKYLFKEKDVPFLLKDLNGQNKGTYFFKVDLDMKNTLIDEFRNFMEHTYPDLDEQAKIIMEKTVEKMENHIITLMGFKKVIRNISRNVRNSSIDSQDTNPYTSVNEEAYYLSFLVDIFPFMENILSIKKEDVSKISAKPYLFGFFKEFMHKKDINYLLLGCDEINKLYDFIGKAS